MQQVKGAVLKSRLAFVERQSGKPAVERVLNTLPPDMQRTLKMLFTSNWYPFQIGKALDDAIVQVLGGGRPEYFERLGEASAETNLATIHASYLTKGDAHAFLAKSPSIYSLYYETGRREYQPDRTEGRRAHDPRRGDVQRAGLPHGGRVVPQGAGDVRRPRGPGGGGGVPGEGRDGVPVSGEVGVEAGRRADGQGSGAAGQRGSGAAARAVSRCHPERSEGSCRRVRTRRARSLAALGMTTLHPFSKRTAPLLRCPAHRPPATAPAAPPATAPPPSHT